MGEKFRSGVATGFAIAVETLKNRNIGWGGELKSAALLFHS